ncbi:hypothetical protein AAIB41_02405 [Brucella sp. BE17]|uniref:hypothetical protein n=1 Tax=Brucella sp. BE17 TaxID=3142977 RepID=UPI0031BA8C4A
MNICVFVYAKTQEAGTVSGPILRSLLNYLIKNGLADEAPEATFNHTSGRTTLINTNRLGDVWSLPPFWEDNTGAVSLSTLPMSVDTALSRHDFHADIKARIKSPKALRYLLPPFMGSYHLDGVSGVFTDALGIGRAYMLESDLFFVASNAIAPCLFFDSELAEEDTYAWQLFSGFGWFTGTHPRSGG